MKIFLEKTIKTNFNQNRNLKTKVKNMKRVILTSSQPVTLVRKDGPRPKPAKLIKGAIFKTRNIGGVSTKREPRLIATSQLIFLPLQTHTMNWSFGLVGDVSLLNFPRKKKVFQMCMTIVQIPNMRPANSCSRVLRTTSTRQSCPPNCLLRLTKLG